MLICLEVYLGGLTRLASNGLALAHGLVLGAAGLELVGDGLLAGLLGLLLEDGLHEHTLVLVHVTLALLVISKNTHTGDNRGHVVSGVVGTGAFRVCHQE